MPEWGGNPPATLSTMSVEYSPGARGVGFYDAWIVYGLRADYVWIMYGLCMDYVWITRGLRMDYIWIIHALCIGCVWIMYGLCMGYA